MQRETHNMSRFIQMQERLDLLLHNEKKSVGAVAHVNFEILRAAIKCLKVNL